MKTIFAILLTTMFFAHGIANTNKNEINCNSKVLIELDCNSIYNATHDYMMRRFSKDIADKAANDARQACYDENEAAAGTNDDCKPVVNELKKS